VKAVVHHEEDTTMCLGLRGLNLAEKNFEEDTAMAHTGTGKSEQTIGKAVKCTRSMASKI
jgi:hypothetical protein